MKKTIKALLLAMVVILPLCLVSCGSVLPLRTNSAMQAEMDENVDKDFLAKITPYVKPEPNKEFCLKWGHTPATLSGYSLIDYRKSTTQHWKICQDCKELYDYEEHYASDAFLTRPPSGIIFNGVSYLQTEERCVCGAYIGASMKYITGGDAE